jgi:hypothetical protein
MLLGNVSSDEKNEMLRLRLKQILNLFPVAGPILNDIFFEYRNNVKQERLNHFVSLLEDAFNKYDIKVEKLKSEEMLDLLEQSIKKVSNTRSANKRVAFKNILLKGINGLNNINDCEIFNELLDDLKEKQLHILVEHQKYLSDGQPLLFKLNDLNNQFRNNQPGQTYIYTEIETHVFREKLKHDIQIVKELLEEYKEVCNHSLFQLEQNQYQYFLRDLLAKGLLIDQGIGTYDPTPLQYMSITAFGVRFLDFVTSE